MIRSARFLRLCVCALALAVVVGSQASGSVPRTQAIDGTTTELMSFSEVRVGMVGTGYTVVRGTERESFSAEVLGVLHNVFPRRDLIVARLTGLGLERAGVLAGMSGSPVYIDGRLVGAVAYRLVNFGHEAVAGVVPIEDMLEVSALESDGRGTSVAADISPELALRAASALLIGSSGAEGLLPPRLTTQGVQAISIPVAISGLSPALVGRLAPLFDALGWTATLGGTAGSMVIKANFEPGGMVGVQLVRGDVNITASGTITYRDGDRLLAFGHPFLRGGNVDFPMVPAQVITVLSSAQASSKLAAAGDQVVGAVRQDRQTAILGVIGERPRMVPVHTRIEDGGRTERLDFEIVADRLITPLYLFFGLVSGVQSLDRAFGEGSIEVDARMDLGGGFDPVRFGNLFSSADQAIVSLSSTLAGLFRALYDNEFEPVDVEAIDVSISLRHDRRSATISRVWYDRASVRPGETITLTVALKPFRGPEVLEQLKFTVPPGTPPGSVTLVIGDAASIDRRDVAAIGGANRSRSLAHVVRLLNNLRRSDRLYLQATRSAAGAMLNGAILPALPPSVLQVLSSEQTRGDVVRLDHALILEVVQPVDYVVSGSHEIAVQVRSR
jgi:hypothetical protein